MRNTHFARVEPIVGRCLRRKSVALLGLPLAAPIVTHLAACGVGRWRWVDPDDGSDAMLRANLLAQHGAALSLDARALPLEAWFDVVRRGPMDLVIGVGGANERAKALEAARKARIPALLVASPTLTRPCQIIVHFSGDESCLGTQSSTSLRDVWDWSTAAPLCAGLARGMLLRDTAYCRDDLERLWEAGMRVVTLGSGDDPLAVRWSTLAKDHGARGRFRTPAARRGKLLVVGLGSLGSVAAMYLAPHATGMVLADPDCVEVYNPVRQAYSLETVGRPKAQALRERLLAAGGEAVLALETALVTEREVIDVIRRWGITAALVVTGTGADFAVARALRTFGVPHVVGRCYPRARYWEAILVDGRRGPSLGDLRGHLHLGPAPPPTPEQVAAYSDVGALEAEPATLVESGWAAAWMARLTAQLLAPSGLRERWLLELLAAERTCLIGGVGVQLTQDGPAYGITLPGQIRAWGRHEIKSPRPLFSQRDQKCSNHLTGLGRALQRHQMSGLRDHVEMSLWE